MADHMPADAAPVVVDVGANDGESWSNSRLFGLRGWRLLLIEPMPEYAERCRRLYEGNPQVAVEEVAIAERPGTAEFHISADASTDQLAMRSSLLPHMVPGGRSRAIRVACEPLQDVLLRHEIPRDLAVLNVDAEGLDLAVLRSVDLDMFRPRFICVEEGEFGPEIERHLAGRRYRRVRTLGPNGIYMPEELAPDAAAPEAARTGAAPASAPAPAGAAAPPPPSAGAAPAETETATLLAAADAFHALGRSLDGAGHGAIGLHLHAAASAIDRALPPQPGWWSGPFNGQEGRARLFLRLLEALRPAAVVETGTFRGTTTAFIAEHFAGPVLTCELDRRWFLTAKANLEAHPRVEVRHQDSRAFLRALLAAPPGEPLLCYLDAHWEADLPLREEIELILSAGRPAAVMIDDFAVPGDPGYAYDDYGPGKALTVDLLAGIPARGAALFFPTLPAREETGARRGCAVIGVGGAAAALAGMAELRPHPWPEGPAAPAAAGEGPAAAPPGRAAELAPLRRLLAAPGLEAERDAQRARAEAAEAEATALRDRAELIAAEADAQCVRLQAALDEAEAGRRLVRAIHESTSWRVTAPLRWIRRLLSP